MIFKKVSLEQWKKDINAQGISHMNEEFWYDNIKLPKRATKGSAGYDFFAPYSMQLLPQSELIIPTGIRFVTEKEEYDKVLLLYPRSGLGFKYGIKLANTVGVIDADYCEADNEGHIMIKIINPSDQIVTIERGKGFAQGIITQYYTVVNDTLTNKKRTGGFGSTDNK